MSSKTIHPRFLPAKECKHTRQDIELPKPERGLLFFRIVEIILTALLVFVTYQSVSLQRQLTDLQGNMNRYAIRPNLQGQFLHYDGSSTHDTLHHNLFQLCNIGADTAFGVWYEARWMVVNETVVVFDRFRPAEFAVALDAGKKFGNYTDAKSRTIPPGEAIDIPCNVERPSDSKIAELLGGLLLLQIRIVYWDKLPRESFETTEYFALNVSVDMFYEHARLDQLDNGSFLLNRVKDLLSGPSVGFIERLDCTGEESVSPYRCVYATRSPSLAYGTIWGWRDTLVWADNSLISATEYRRRHPECVVAFP